MIFPLALAILSINAYYQMLACQHANAKRVLCVKRSFLLASKPPHKKRPTSAHQNFPSRAILLPLQCVSISFGSDTGFQASGVSVG